MAGAADPTSGAVLAVGGYTDEGPLAGCGILRAPTVVFDKVRYVDGDAITVTGLGWTPGEKVTLQVSTQSFAKPGTISQIVQQSFQPVASALGRIQQTLFNASTQNAGATYKATASGGTSGFTAGNSARQVSRTTVTLNVSPFPALTRQPVVLQAIVQPATALDPLDGQVNFQAGGSPAGSVSSAGQFTVAGNTGQITDGTSNTIQVGEPAPLPPNATGFSRTFVAADGSVRFVSQGGGVFQLVTQSLPAGTNVLTANSTGSATASYAAFTSLYGPNSATTTVSVQKRTVNVNMPQLLFATPPKVGDPIALQVLLTPTQLPFADVAPTGSVHLTLAPGNVVDAPLTQNLFNSSARANFSVMLPAGTANLLGSVRWRWSLPARRGNWSREHDGGKGVGGLRPDAGEDGLHGG